MSDSRDATVTFTESEWNVVMTALSFIDKRVASPIVTKMVDARRPTEALCTCVGTGESLQAAHYSDCPAQSSTKAPRRPCTYDPATGECAGSCRYCEGWYG